jgi:WD40 repeat protein
VSGLVLGLNGRVYSGSNDGTIRVWSGDDGAHIQTLEGHTKGVSSMVWGPEGKLYSASYGGTIRVWSDGCATIVQTSESSIHSLAWVDGNLFAALAKKILVWSSDQLRPTDPPAHVLDYADHGEKYLAVGSSGDLYCVANSVIVKM